MRYFDRATQVGGINARTRLSVLTQVASVQARVMEDTQENISRFAAALDTVEQEFSDTERRNVVMWTDVHKEKKTSLVEVVTQLRNNMSLVSDLMAQQVSQYPDKEVVLQRVTEAMADGLKVDRASVWLYDEERTKIVCQDLFERSKLRHSKGVELLARDYPAYFQSLRYERTVAASNAQQDPSTREFCEGYLKPLGINSMLDVPIWVKGTMVGVLCNEHVGPLRDWTMDEENFAAMLGYVVSLSLV